MKREKSKLIIAEDEAIARGVDLSISTKMAIEICDNIRGKPVDNALRHLKAVVEMERPITVRKFNWDLGHKPGYGPARYPVNTAKAFIELLNLAIANEENRGLNSERLVISFAKADFGTHRWHMGRQRRTRMKNTHVEIHVKETEGKSDNAKGKLRGD